MRQRSRERGCIGAGPICVTTSGGSSGRKNRERGQKSVCDQSLLLFSFSHNCHILALLAAALNPEPKRRSLAARWKVTRVEYEWPYWNRLWRRHNNRRRSRHGKRPFCFVSPYFIFFRRKKKKKKETNPLVRSTFHPISNTKTYRKHVYKVRKNKYKNLYAHNARAQLPFFNTARFYYCVRQYIIM